MGKEKFLLTTFLICFSALIFSVFGQESNRNIYYKIDINEEINGITWMYLKNGFEDSYQYNPKGIFIHLNTYGGLVVFADSIRTKILNSDIPVYVFIDNNAASAGALISIACDSIYMRPGGNIGAATVVNDSGEKMPDKYQSYMRATIRSTAESHGKDTIISGSDTLVKWKRDPQIAEAMVDERIAIPGLIDSTQILTFTAQEAVQYGYCEGIYENIDEIITESLHDSDYEVVEYKPGIFDQIKGFLINPVVHGILIMIIIGGIYFEMQTPGIGFPLLAAGIAVILYFAPLYIDGLLEVWEILLFLAGIILLLVEIFIIPGFGIFGVLGIIFAITGLVLSLVQNDFFDFDGVLSTDLTSALFTVLGGITGAIVISVYISAKIGTKGIFRKLALETTQDPDKGYVGVEMEPKSLVGMEGIAKTVLRPSGKVLIESDVYDAIAENGFIDSGEKIIVRRYASGQLYVTRSK
jgi:membrane-bound serine protease (ClpP class)